MEEQNAQNCDNFDREEFSFQDLDPSSPEDNFTKPKTKEKSPCWEMENIIIQSNLDGILKYNDHSHEYSVKQDIFGKPISEVVSSPFTYHSTSTKDDSSRHNSHNKSSGKHSIDEVEEVTEEFEWDLDKENQDPSGSLLTPLKTNKKVFGRGGANSGNNTGRSPLQDITPPIAKKKQDSSKIEVLTIQIFVKFLENPLLQWNSQA